MQRNKIVLCLLAIALVASSLQATMVLKMGLGDMANRAGSIFRGTVVSASPGSIEVGGTTLRTVDYVIEVTDALKGDFQSRGEKSFATIRMLSGIKGGSAGEDGMVKRFSKLPDMPELEVGGDYLLLTTTPGPTGLSTTVGLGQGRFSVNKETAVNELNNFGLYEGPVAYDVIANDIRAALGQ